MGEIVITKMLEVIPKDRKSLIKSLLELEYQDDNHRQFWNELQEILIGEIRKEDREDWENKVHKYYHWYMTKDVFTRM
jgi:hypothetical protein